MASGAATRYVALLRSSSEARRWRPEAAELTLSLPSAHLALEDGSLDQLFDKALAIDIELRGGLEVGPEIVVGPAVVGVDEGHVTGDGAGDGELLGQEPWHRYHPSVIDQFPERFNDCYRTNAGLEPYE